MLTFNKFNWFPAGVALLEGLVGEYLNAMLDLLFLILRPGCIEGARGSYAGKSFSFVEELWLTRSATP